MSQVEMMAVGDSLYQGVRSMTIRKDLCATSIPAQVAARLGLADFTSPDPGQPMLIDPEVWMGDLFRIDEDLTRYGAFWQANPVSPSGRTMFDNLAVAGAETWHLYRYSAQNGANDAKAEFDKLKGQNLTMSTMGQVSLNTLIFGINARFVLNPSNDPELARMTQLDWVAARKPKRLLVDIGSNNGLWDICINGDPEAKFYFGKNYGGTGDADDFTQMEELAEALDRLPPEVEVIYFNNQARPRTVPNLMPIPDQVQWEVHPGDGYFGAYENRFATSMTYHRMTGAQMKAMDEYVAQVNARIQDIVSHTVKSRKVVFVDLYTLLSDNDAKHYGDARATMAGGKRISNNMFESDPWGGMAHGGMFGLDGMHPTTVGYAKVAQQVVNQIYATEYPGQTPPIIALDPVCNSDWLIQHCAGKWTPLLYLWRDIRRGGRSDAPDPAVHVLRAMGQGRAGAR